MAAERLSMRKIREILRQKWALGQSHREVAASLGVSVGIVAKTVLRATTAKLTWGSVAALDVYLTQCSNDVVAASGLNCNLPNCGDGAINVAGEQCDGAAPERTRCRSRRIDAPLPD